MNLYQLGKRLLPQSLKTSLRHALEEMRSPNAELESLKTRVDGLEATLFHLAPAEIPISEEVEHRIQRFRDGYRIDGELEVAVSKRDVMFRYLEFIRPGLPEAYSEYLVTGLQAFQAFDGVVEERFGGFDQIGSVLDFASGYGRMTRFLVRSARPEQVWVSDIKPRAVAFQREKFGVQGWAAPADPADFPTEMRFDAIFAASFFSHAPQNSFSDWLRALSSALSDRGVLVFSVNDISMVPSQAGEDFHYHAMSEEAFFPYLDDDAPGGEEYGETYVSESYVRDVLAELGFPDEQVQRTPKGIWNIQDLYVVER
jgi:SAM-dependent methyltransferase